MNQNIQDGPILFVDTHLLSCGVENIEEGKPDFNHFSSSLPVAASRSWIDTGARKSGAKSLRSILIESK